MRLGVGLLLLLVVVLVVLWWRAPELYDSSDVDPGDQAAATATTRAGILAVFAATIAAIGAIVALAETRRANLAAHERELGALGEAQRANLAADEREREAQAADRYTRAISQLGEPGEDRVDVRLGGIFALQRLAQDFPSAYLTAVVEVLCAFVRHHGRGPEGDSREALEKYRPPADVQAALTVVGRVHGLDAGSEDIELVEAHLERAQLPDANLTDALLIKAHLTHAFLYRAKLERAELFGADLKWVVLSHAFLVGAYLRSAKLTEADLTDADLTDADLTDADLTDADLTDAILNGADLSNTKGLDQDQLNASQGDARTRLPEDLTQPPHWTDGPSAADAENIREP